MELCAQSSSEHASGSNPPWGVTPHAVHATVLCHFYNEEYLLPFWLKHHRSMFTHGILIDYHSTDRSVEIIRELCPTWDVRTSRNAVFQADLVDHEVMDIEACIQGYKIALNVTEFLVASKPFDRTDLSNCFRIEAYIVIPDSTMTDPSDDVQFWRPIDTLAYQSERGYRALHSHQRGCYSTGRHSTHHLTHPIDHLFILWCGFYPWNARTIQRKLQIQHRIPDSDKACGNGHQHLWGVERMEQEIQGLPGRSQTRLCDLYSRSSN